MQLTVHAIKCRRSSVLVAVVLPAGLLFFTTYTLLVLFWAEIYHQARSMPTGSLRPIFIAFNALVYACQVGVVTASNQQHRASCTACKA
jgi:hypothetical protein